MEQKLKPCPFCGGEASVVFQRPTRLGVQYLPYSVWCSECEAEMTAFETREEAIQAWNTRTLPNIPMSEAWSAIPENVDTTMFWQAQEGDCICGNHVTRDEHDYCNRCGRKLLWERVRSAQGSRTNG